MKKSKVNLTYILTICWLAALCLGLNLSAASAATPSEVLQGALSIAGTSETNKSLTLSQHGDVQVNNSTAPKQFIVGKKGSTRSGKTTVFGNGDTYFNDAVGSNKFITANGTTSNTQHRYDEYKLTDSDPIKTQTIRLANGMNKCVTLQSGPTIDAKNGTNVMLDTCSEDNKLQQWHFNSFRMIRFANDLNLCLEIQGSTPNNGANVEVWTCNSRTNAQQWIYDGLYQQIHSATNYNKCLALPDGKTDNNTNLEIRDCKSFETQQWIVDGYTFNFGRAIQLTHSSTPKCIHTRDGWKGNGAWLELWDCLGTYDQRWVVDGLQINAYSSAGTLKCFTAENASTTNGTQLLLWDCHEDDHQQWIYDGVMGLYRSKMDLKKCLSLSKKTIANGTPIQLMDCAVTADQQWYVDGALTHPSSEPTHTIQPAYAPDKCFNTKQGSTDNGTNVELWDCLGTEAQLWYFSSAYIKSHSDHNKCLTVTKSDGPNGSNIYLNDCTGAYNQEWVYDGLTKSIRSRSMNKCIHIKEGSSANGANVELWNCLGTVAQQFDIQ